jgi:hypothetical protein
MIRAIVTSIFVVAAIGVEGCAGQVALRRQTCDHFRGEEPYSAERRAELEAASDKYCRGTDRELAALRSKYRNNAGILKVLDTFENDIEAK